MSFHAAKSAGFFALRAGFLFVLFAGCSTTHYKESADKEVYQALAEKTAAVPGIVQDFDIEDRPEIDLTGLPINEVRYEYLGAEAEQEIGASIVSLDEALRLAFTHSREYQSQREALYLEALSLTLDRYEFQPMWSAGASADYIFASMEDSMGGSSRTDSFDLNGNIGMSHMLKSGGRFTADLTSNFFQFLSSNPQANGTSAVVLNFTQPLMRGSGKSATEFLTQAERDLIYQLRDFTRFRKSFSVRIASSYYRVLQSRNTVENQFYGLQAVEKSLRREEAFLEEGLRTPSQVARLQQDFLSRDAGLTQAIVSYKNSLDDFKILMGLPIRTKLVLDEHELTALTQEGLITPEFDLDAAVEVALISRLDLMINRDNVDDAGRRLEVAENLLGPDLNFVATGRINSKEGNRLATLDLPRSQWTAGLELDLPLNRMAERNNYRRAIIDVAVAERNLDLSEDQVIQEVRDAWRNIESFRKDYEISELSLGLSKRRVEEEEIKSELGRGTILDLVDAQNALTASESELTRAIVNYNVSLLELWRDVGILYVDQSGKWKESGNA